MLSMKIINKPRSSNSIAGIIIPGISTFEVGYNKKAVYCVRSNKAFVQSCGVLASPIDFPALTDGRVLRIGRQFLNGLLRQSSNVKKDKEYESQKATNHRHIIPY